LSFWADFSSITAFTRPDSFRLNSRLETQHAAVPRKFEVLIASKVGRLRRFLVGVGKPAGRGGTDGFWCFFSLGSFQAGGHGARPD